MANSFFKNLWKRKANLLCAFCGLGFILVFCSFQSVENPKQKEGVQNSVREEIQRYMGYEPLLQRYLSLPYDAGVNSNVQGAFVDISYLLLACLPIIFLLGFKNKPLLGILTAILLLFFIIVSISNGILFSSTKGFVNFTQIEEQNITDFPVSLVSVVYQNIHEACQPLDQFISNLTGERDHVTYPIMILLFVSGFFMLQQRIRELEMPKVLLINFVFLFAFLWVLLTAGIIWYGYPILALSILFIVHGFLKYTEDEDWLGKSKRYLGMAVLALFIFIATIYRFSNYKTFFNPKLAKHIFDIGEINYQTGRSTTDEVFSGFFVGGALGAIKKINSEENSLIYKVGTFLPYFVKKNDTRVLNDNQLGIFYNLNKKYPNNGVLADVLQANGYKYILVDLNTHTIDKTPEKTLEKKFIDFLTFCYQNSKLRLIATNRLIDTSNGEGQPNYIYEVFGNIVPNGEGSYAIYEIL